MNMNVSRRTLVKAAVAGTVLTAGCGDGDPDETEPGDDPGESETTGDPGAGGDDTTEETEGSTDTGEDTETETQGGGDAAVQVGSAPNFDDLLVGSDQMTLYMFDQDSQGSGESACTDDCTNNWPPLTVEEGEPAGGENVTAELSTFEREDGSMQVTANGWPLYHFANDEEPGDTNGQGVNDAWWVLGPDGSPIRPNGSPTETGTGTVVGNETAEPNDGSTDTETESP